MKKTKQQESRVPGYFPLGSGTPVRAWVYTPSLLGQLRRSGIDSGLGWISGRARDMVISEHWSLPAWAISCYVVKFKGCVFSVLWPAEEVTFLSGH